MIEYCSSVVQEQLAQSLFDHIPVGVGSKGIIPMNARDLEEALEMGMDWSLREGKITLILFVVSIRLCSFFLFYVLASRLYWKVKFKFVEVIFHVI